MLDNSSTLLSRVINHERFFVETIVSRDKQQCNPQLLSTVSGASRWPVLIRVTTDDTISKVKAITVQGWH
jgi:hypothetical protein